MKICVISTPVFAVPVKGYSGLEHLAWLIAKGLAERGHEVSIVAPEGSSCPGAAVIPCGPAGTWDEQRAYMRYWEHLQTVDAVIDHTWCKWSYMLKEEGRLKAPVLGVCHAPVNTMYGSLPPVESPCFVCISKDQADHFRALFGREAKVAYNGVDTDYYRPMDGVARTDRWLFLARFSTIKGPDLAIQACRNAGVGLDLVGDTTITNEPEFFQQCSAMCDVVPFRQGLIAGTVPEGGRPPIRMVGPATRGECVRWFSQAFALLHPNQRFREPFGLAPVEAMACGCPVLAWDYGAMRETVKHGETGFLCNSMADLTMNVKLLMEKGPERIMEMRAACRERASMFTVGKMVERYESLCREAIEGGW